MKFFESAVGEGFPADGFNRAGNFDALERPTRSEGFLADLDDRDSVNMIRNHHRALETFVAPGDANA